MEKPILFNTEMVKAILEGRKTTTRRALKQPFEVHPNGFITKAKGNERLIPYEPPYKKGDIIYVRETWWQGDILNSNEDIEESNVILYYADEEKENLDYETIRWKPSIHMPKELARLFLKVTDVRVERLQDITEEQIKREGIKEEFPPLAQDRFRDLWDSTLKKDQLEMYGWNANPYVWVIEFEKIEK